MQEQINLFNEDESSNEPCLDDKKIEILNLPVNIKHSNYFISNIINLKDTYTTKIFIGLIAIWNKWMYQTNSINSKNDNELSSNYYTIENLQRRNKKIEIKTAPFLKQIGIAEPDGSYDSIRLRQALEHFNQDSKFSINILKTNNPELYKHIESIVLADSPAKEIRFSTINLFSSIYQTKEEPGLPSYIGFNLTNEAVPIFDAIVKNYTLVSLESIAVLKKTTLKLYDVLKAILGNQTYKNFTIWLEPSETNTNFYNLRTILDYLETTKTGKYKYRGNDLITRTLECFKEINENCKDLYIDFNFNKEATDYESQFIKKGVKYQGIKLKLYSYNPNDPLPIFELIKKYNSCEYVRNEYLNQEFILDISKKDSELCMSSVLNILDGEKFREMYWNPKTMTEEIFVELKKDYLDLCYATALEQYKDLKDEYGNSDVWKFTITRLMRFYLLNGKNIYDGQVFKNSAYASWTPNDKVDKYKLKCLAKNPNYIEEHAPTPPELIEAFHELWERIK